MPRNKTTFYSVFFCVRDAAATRGQYLALCTNCAVKNHLKQISTSSDWSDPVEFQWNTRAKAGFPSNATQRNKRNKRN